MRLCKYLIILICISLLTGCTFEYNIKINKQFIKEEGNVLNYDKTTWNEQNYLGTDKTYTEIINNKLNTYEKVYKSDEESYINPYIKNDEYEYYNKKLISSKDVYGIKYFYEEELERYNDTRMSNMCYDNVDIINNKNTFKISTSNVFSCFDIYTKLDKVEVNVTTSWDYEVISSNADKEKDGKYTWIITKENASNKPIEISVKKVFNWRIVLIIAIPILLVAVIVYIVLRKKLFNNNQI